MMDLQSAARLFIDTVNSTTGRINQYYQLMHFFARISACDKYEYYISRINSAEYPLNFIRSKFGNNAAIIHTTMDEIITFKDFEKQKGFIRYLFEERKNYFW